eukprot:4563401-Pyramimonas_sp.AAC.1
MFNDALRANRLVKAKQIGIRKRHLDSAVPSASCQQLITPSRPWLQSDEPSIRHIPSTLLQTSYGGELEVVAMESSAEGFYKHETVDGA